MKYFSLKSFVYIEVLLGMFLSFSYSTLAFATESPTFRMFVFSDIHLNVHKKGPSSINPFPVASENFRGQGVKSNYANGPSDLYIDTYKELLSILKRGNFISQNFSTMALLLGDLNAHANYKKKENLQKIYTSMQELFANYNIPILNTFGNNDSLQTDYGPFQYQEQSIYDIAMHSNWRDGFLSSGKTCVSLGINEPQYPCLNPLKAENKQYGYYTAYLQSRLKLIDLNTVMFDPKAAFFYTEEERQRELTWLQNELQSSVEKKENVIIAMHIPPNRAWASSFNKILLSTKPGVITAVLAGHTHMNESHSLISYRGRKMEQLIPLIITPALSTIYGVASGFNILTIAEQNQQWVLKDIATYSFQKDSLSDSITLKNAYSFDEEYCPGIDVTVADCMKKNIENEKYFTLLSEHYTNENPNNHQGVNARRWIWKAH